MIKKDYKNTSTLTLTSTITLTSTLTRQKFGF